MKVILFGATGMVGQGALKACLADPDVTEILAVVRSPLSEANPKLQEVFHKDFSNFSSLEDRFKGFDACFFCLGVSSAGMNETDYRRITYGFTMVAASTLAKINPHMTFVYISGMGADSTEKGPVMWARVRGELENALLRLPLRAFVLRPGAIEPMDGITSKTLWVKVSITLFKPLFPLLKKVFPRYVTTTRQIGHALLKLAREGSPLRIFECWNINEL